MAERKGLPESRPFNDLGCLTGPFGPIEPKRFFPGLSNDDGPPQNRTAASTGIEGGGNGYENGANRLADFYRLCPIIAMHFGVEVLP